jgi:hypothetical protein
LTEEQESDLDTICDEISNFSYYYQSYCLYIYNLIWKCTNKGITDNKSKQDRIINTSLKEMQRDLQFPLVDELVNNYIMLEKFYVKNCLFKGVLIDN